MLTHPIPRREFLVSGLGNGGATLLGACTPERALAPPLPEPAAPAAPRTALAADGDLREPAVILSVGGMLAASIAATTHPVTVAGRTMQEPVTYGDAFPGPTLVVRPGDWVDLRFANKIVFDQADTHPGYGRPPRKTNATNLHFHGMHMEFDSTPLTKGVTADNMLVSVEPYATYRYHFQVPTDHPAGLFWYHAHVHGLVTNQVGRGAAGMLVVANAYTDEVARRGIRRRLMMLQQAYLDVDDTTLIADDGNRDDPQLALSLINGQLTPDIGMRPGEPQVWSLLNASTSAFYLLKLEGHTFDVIADDGIPLRAPRLAQESLMLASAKRLEVVVRAAGAGSYKLYYEPFNQGVDTWPYRHIANVLVGGERWTGPAHPGVDTSVQLEDLSRVSVDPDLRRTIVLGTNTNVDEGQFGRFTINGHAWDPTYSEWTSALGTVEEWHIENDTDQDHPFHVHVNPFQVTRINNRPVPFDGYQDTAIVPRNGSITVRTRFTDFVGTPVLMHCHILDHEDMGMMTKFEIVDPRAA